MESSYVDLAIGKIDYELVTKTRGYLWERGCFVVSEGRGNLKGFPYLVTPGSIDFKDNYSLYIDVFHLSTLNGVAVLKQYWQSKNPQLFATLTCSITGINKVLNDLFLENLVLSVVDSDTEKSSILKKLKSR